MCVLRRRGRVRCGRFGTWRRNVVVTLRCVSSDARVHTAHTHSHAYICSTTTDALHSSIIAKRAHSGEQQSMRSVTRSRTILQHKIRVIPRPTFAHAAPESVDFAHIPVGAPIISVESLSRAARAFGVPRVMCRSHAARMCFIGPCAHTQQTTNAWPTGQK